ncbi:MAG: sigma-70 family RNA polymerase sigma factor [Candidatus Eisenbacteria bacterium]
MPIAVAPRMMVDRYKHRVYWMARRMLGSEEVEDVAQDVFVRVYQTLPNFRSDSKFGTWIYKITRNLCISTLRKRNSCPKSVSLDATSDESASIPVLAARDKIEEGVEREDLSQTVRALMDRLPESHRTVLTLFYMNQMSYEEIAGIMEIPLGTVKTHIHRARLRLRELVLAETRLSLANDLGLGGPSRAGSGTGARREADTGGERRS